MIKPKRAPYTTTSVSPDATYAKIQTMLIQAGCDAVQITRTSQGDVSIRFVVEVELKGQHKKIAVEIRPSLLATRRRAFGRTGPVVSTTNEAATARLALWYIKSKLEAVQFGLVSAEREFFSQIMVALPGGGTGTVGDMAERSVLSGGGVILPGIGMDDRPRQLPSGSTEAV